MRRVGWWSRNKGGSDRLAAIMSDDHGKLNGSTFADEAYSHREITHVEGGQITLLCPKNE